MKLGTFVTLEIDKEDLSESISQDQHRLLEESLGSVCFNRLPEGSWKVTVTIERVDEE